jgi:hypothetical protein
METVIEIEARVIGRRSANLERRPISLSLDTSQPVTVETLLTTLVHSEVAAFAQRQEARSIVHLPTEAELSRWLQAGKVTFAGSGPTPVIVIDDAIANAARSFQDGLFQVVIDGATFEHLDDIITLSDNSQVVLLRLVALAGG